MLLIAVLGCGRIGRMRAHSSHSPQAALAGVFDVHEPAADEVAERLACGNFLLSRRYSLLPKSMQSSSPLPHRRMPISSSRRSQRESPFSARSRSTSLSPGSRLVREKIAGAVTPIILGFVRRFDPGHRAVRDAVRAGAIGDLHQVVITSRDPGMAPKAYIEASGGIFRDMTIHDFDMARFILGEEPTEVTAVGARLVDPELMARCEDWDTVSVVLKTPSGRQCIINNSRRAVYGYDQRVEAFGSAGMAISENRRPHMMTIHGATATGGGAPLLNFFIDRYAEAFTAEIGAFVDAIEKGTPPEVGFEDGRRALLLAEAAIRSVAEGRTVRTSEIG